MGAEEGVQMLKSGTQMEKGAQRLEEWRTEGSIETKEGTHRRVGGGQYLTS